MEGFANWRRRLGARLRALPGGERAVRLLPRPTVRLRLTLVYAGLFLIAGTLLLGVSYALVKRNLSADRPDRALLAHATPSQLRQLFGGATVLYVHGKPAIGYVAPPGAARSAGAGALLPGAGGAPLGPPGVTAAQVRAAEQIRHAIRSQIVGDALHRLVAQYLLALGLLFLASLGLGWLVAGRVLRPLKRITATAKRVSDRTLHERIAMHGPSDELKELADTFDSMLGRLDEAFDGQRRFVANASHELRTPLTVMRTEVEVTLADPHSTVAELREMGTTVREAIERSELLIESLLTLARSDAGDVRATAVDLAMIVEATLEDHRDALDEAGIHARTQLDAAPVIGDPRLLERLVWNLVENGVRHNGGDWLALSTRTVNADVVLVVANGGPAIPPEIASTLLEPFRRSADRTGRGFGLGLSIVRAIARAHGGDVRLQAPVEGGLLVEVVLPADADAERSTAPPVPVALARG